MPTKRSDRLALLGLMAVFALAFVLRATHPISRPPLWWQRANVFLNAVSEQDWASTYTTHHPGFTTMVVGAGALWASHQVEGTPAYAMLFGWTHPAFATEQGRETAVGVMGLSLVTAATITGVVWALHRLAKRWDLAFAAGGFLTLSPFYLAQTRVFHVDGLMAGFMLLSALLALISREENNLGWLAASGVVGGLAVLSKVPAIFLIPFVGLCLLTYAALALIREEERDPIQIGTVAVTQIALPLGLWIVCAALPFVLWPAMWVAPREFLGHMFVNTVGMVETAHPRPEFFAGQVYADEAFGPAFYPTMLMFHSAYLVPLFGLIAVGHFTLWRRRLPASPIAPHLFALMAAYAFFFVIQMSLGEKQIFRYVLPTALMLDVIAAVGVVGLLDLIRPRLTSRRLRSALPAIGVGAVWVLMALVSLPYAPDYGAHRSHLLGANRGAFNIVSVTGQNEGVIAVARYLHQQGIDEQALVTTVNNLDTSLEQYIPAEISREGFLQADYVLFGYFVMQRDLDTELWGGAWTFIQQNGIQPVLTVSYDGVDYLWLYDPDRPDGSGAVTINRGGMAYVALAWVVTLGVVSLTVWALRSTRQLAPAFTTAKAPTESK